ncbi:indolepyruvate ferredoxin oxidoreductase subunit alpha [Streptomyces sp. NPDC086549]|uniref:indolepyruvate ferredoxin oxidoreductase subunit alpha n=1 Tax=Streptomyces sp. NPDC086549 TaxID=3365752 RepID=UPI003826F4F0
MAFVIAEPCVDVKDKACPDACPVDCIYEGERTLCIQPDECIDRSACEPVCPVEVIHRDTEPNGAFTVGPTAMDHDRVAAPPRPASRT